MCRDRDEFREATFWATRGDLVLEFFDATGTDAHGNPDPDATARFTIARAAPWWLWAMTAAGGPARPAGRLAADRMAQPPE